MIQLNSLSVESEASKPWNRPLRLAGNVTRLGPLGMFGLALAISLVVIGIFGPIFAPDDPTDIGVVERYAKPSLGGHLLGGDFLGRDVLSRLLYGARISLIVGFGACGLGTILGAMLGLFGGYIGGKLDLVIQRLVDILMSLPGLILAMALIAAMGRSLTSIIIAISIPLIPYSSRVVRASTLSIKETQYVEAAGAIGCSDLRIIYRHIAPGAFPHYLVVASALIGDAIITESALGFLGLSVPPPTATWGEMLSSALTRLFFAPHLAVAPGVIITLAVFAFSILGDALRDALDPRLRGTT